MGSRFDDDEDLLDAVAASRGRRGMTIPPLVQVRPDPNPVLDPFLSRLGLLPT